MKPTKKQRRVIRAYVRAVADALELRDWTLTIDWGPPEDDGIVARIRCTYGRKLATLEFCEGFASRPLREQRATICHELIHCHLSGLEWTFNNLGSHVSQAVFDIVWGGLKDQVEFATDAMADAVAKHLPLPDYGEKP